MDKFFYTGASPTSATTSLFGDPTGDGWFKMFEFFEVPSQMIGAVGPVAQGTNFDWLRQDTKPGLINLNLIIDEEVFFSVFGSQDQNFNQQLLSFDQLPTCRSSRDGQSWTSTTTPPPVPLAAGASPIPLVVTATLARRRTGGRLRDEQRGRGGHDRLTSTLDHRMKASFAQFLSLRHGGSGFVFGYGSGATGQNFAVATRRRIPTPRPTPNNLIPADRPFHSLSYPDINYTIMRPAALPPSAYTDPLTPTTPPTPAWPPTGTRAITSATPACGIRRSTRDSPPTPARPRRGAYRGQHSRPDQASRAAGHPGPPVVPAAGRSTPITTTPPLACHEQRERAGGSVHQQPHPRDRASGHRRAAAVPGPAAGTTYSVNDGVVNLFWVPGGTTPPQPPATTPPTGDRIRTLG